MDLDVEIVIPVYNEEADLAPSVLRLHRPTSTSFPFSYRITIADNASIDGTLEHRPAARAAARARARRAPRARRDAVARCGPSGRRATRRSSPTWTSTSRRISPRSCRSSRHCSRATATSPSAPGSRRDSRVVRGRKRELISRSYNLLLRVALRARFSDAQCGFKAIRSDCARSLLPLVEDTGWFFDTELLVLAERAGLRIHEVPVDWVEDPDSRVDIIATALGDLRGVRRVAWGLARGRIPLAGLRRELGRHARDRERGQAAPRPRAPPPPPLLILAASPQGAPPMSATIAAPPQTPRGLAGRLDSHPTTAERGTIHGADVRRSPRCSG